MTANNTAKPVILWFKRDLRLTDNPAMVLAQELGPTIALVCIEPSIWTGNDYSKRHLSFYLSALTSLNKSLIKLNVPLYIIEDEFITTLNKLYSKIPDFFLVSHQETGNWLTFKRDEKVLCWCKKNNIDWHQPRQNNVIRNLLNRDLWTKHWSDFMNSPCLISPNFSKNKSIKTVVLNAPFERILDQSTDKILSNLKIESKIYDLPITTFLHPTNSFLQKLMDGFFNDRAINYQKKMGSPITSIHSCSRFSPYLAWGLVSIREIYCELKKAQEFWRSQSNVTSKLMLTNLYSFEKRLHWRCHFIQKLESEPKIEFDCLHPKMSQLRNRKIESTEEQGKYDAWKNATTGIDFVDACMNFLRETGWINFRMRAMLMSFASYNLWLHWKKTGEHLAQLFLDYEPGIHWPQVQMQSGTTGINTIRVYNPKKQQKDQDPKLDFTHKWTQNSILKTEIVCVETSASIAKKKIWEIKKTYGYSAASKKIYLKHGSRMNRKGLNKYKKKTIKDIKDSSNQILKNNLNLFD